MKILLVRYHDKANINSREIKNIVKNMGFWPPLGLLYLGATLKKNGYKVKVLDVIQKGYNSIEAKNAILNSKADVIGITSTTPEIKGVIEAAQFAKQAGATVVVGGPHVGIFPKETLSYDFIDFAVLGDGEKPFLKLIKYIENKNTKYEDIKGLVYKQDNKIISNDFYIEKNLDDLFFPNWDLVDINSYSRADAKNPLATMVSARGCPYKCGFCYRGKNDKVVRFRDPVNVVDEMEALHKKYGVREIIFCNDTLTLKKDNITTICEEILKRNLKIVWQGATRVDAIDEEMLKLLKRAGLKQLKFGIESGNEKIMRLMNKQISRDKAKQAFDLCKKVGIRTGAYYILGYVDEDEKTLQDTIDFAIELNSDFAMFYSGVPLPKTSFHDLAVEKKLIEKNYWKDYVLSKRSDRLPYLVDNMDYWVQKAFRQFYGRPSLILKKALNIETWLSVLKNPLLIYQLFFPKNA